MGQKRGEPRLVRVDTPEREEYVIREGTTRIGRSRGSDISLRDSAVSRFHCYLLREGDVVRVFDGESKNPARIDGEPANGQSLRSGHTLRVGRCELVYEGPLPAPALAAAPALPVKTTPRRRIARPAHPPIAVLVLALLLIPAAAWILVKGLPELARGKPGAGPGVPEKAAAGRLERTPEGLEDRIAELLRTEAAYRKDAARTADDRRIEELAQEIADLRAELERARSREAARTAVATPPVDPGARSAELETADFGSVKVDGVEREPPAAASQTGKTSVVTTRPPPRRRSPKEIGALVAALRARIDDYATHVITPKGLEPELSDLAGTAGKDGADAMLDIHAHARALERQVEASIDENRRRKDALLKVAAAAPAPEGAGSKTSGYAHGPAAGPELEANQRLLELCGKAVEIHALHLEHLRPLVAAVLRALGTMEDAAALDHLRLRLVSETDTELMLAICRALEAGRHRGAVPALVKRLSSAEDPRLREGLRKALTAIAGVDLGEKAGPWDDWWAREGK